MIVGVHRTPPNVVQRARLAYENRRTARLLGLIPPWSPSTTREPCVGVPSCDEVDLLSADTVEIPLDDVATPSVA